MDSTNSSGPEKPKLKARVLSFFSNSLKSQQSKEENRAHIGSKMFPGMFMRKPNKEAALKQLRVHVALFGAWVAAIRVAPYVLHYFSDSKDELVLDF
ncbi:hypothetical protein R6Q59_016006 [Mikania micrantha]